MSRKILWKKLWPDLGEVKWSKFSMKSLSCLYTRAKWISEVSGALLNCFSIVLKKPGGLRATPGNIRKVLRDWILGVCWVVLTFATGSGWWCARCGGERKRNCGERVTFHLFERMVQREEDACAVSTSSPRGDHGWRLTARMQVACRDQILLSRRAIWLVETENLLVSESNTLRKTREIFQQHAYDIFLGKFHKNVDNFFDFLWNGLRIVWDQAAWVSFICANCQLPENSVAKVVVASRNLGLHKIFMKSDENHWKSMKFGIEDGNLHSFWRGIRISSWWKLIPMKNIEFSSKLNIFREPDLSFFFWKSDQIRRVGQNFAAPPGA